MISRESQEYWQELRKHPGFGAVGHEFNLDELRQSMAARQAPANGDVKCIRAQIDNIPCEWIVAPGALRGRKDHKVGNRMSAAMKGGEWLDVPLMNWYRCSDK